MPAIVGHRVEESAEHDAESEGEGHLALCQDATLQEYAVTEPTVVKGGRVKGEQ